MTKAIGLSSRDPLVSDMCYGLGRCHLLLGHFDQAIELFYRVRAVRPQYWDIHMWLAAALGCNADLDGSRGELTEAIELKPEVDSLARGSHRAHSIKQLYRLVEVAQRHLPNP